MENDALQRIKHIMNWGAISGLALIATSAMGAFMPSTNIFQLLSWLALGAGIYMGIQKQRDQLQNGFISFSDAAFSGLQIAFFASILLGFFMYVYLKYIDASALEKMLDVQEQLLLQKDMPTVDIKNNMDVMRKVISPELLGIGAVLAFTFIGGIMGLLVAALIKKDSDSFDDFVGK
ncbi:MAG: DUF4199 domain-containing protein [Bacteroidia bacterium]